MGHWIPDYFPRQALGSTGWPKQSVPGARTARTMKPYMPPPSKFNERQYEVRWSVLVMRHRLAEWKKGELEWAGRLRSLGRWFKA